MEFGPGTPLALRIGCAITAFDGDDALRLLAEVFDAPPRPVRVIHDVDVSALDSGHVLPNMNPPNERGVWFPQVGPYR